MSLRNKYVPGMAESICRGAIDPCFVSIHTRPKRFAGTARPIGNFMLPNALSTVLYGFVGSQILLTADELGVFNALARVGPAQAEAIAQRTVSSTDKMRRILNAASLFGLVHKDGDSYRLADDLRTFLDPDAPDYCGGLLAHFRKSTLPAFEHLRAEISGDRDRGRQSAPFASIYRDKEAARSFLDAMWNLGYAASCELVQDEIFSSHRVLVDIGGATGSLSIASLERHATLQATIFDLPEVGPYLEERHRKHPRVGSRLTFVPGDFWADPIPHGDMYAFGYIFSDWCDEDCLHLARKAFDALPGGGRILVLEKFLDENGTGPLTSVMQDLAMMVETGGRHRRQSEYEAMLRQAGFRALRTIRSSGEKHIVTGVKPA